MPLRVHGDARVCTDPEYFAINDTEKTGIKFRVVSSNPRSRPDNDEQDYFYGAVMFVRKADKRLPFKKGDVIFIRGADYTVRTFQDKDTGARREWHEIMIHDWVPAVWPSSQTQDQDTTQQATPAYSPPQQPQPQQVPQPQQMPPIQVPPTQIPSQPNYQPPQAQPPQAQLPQAQPSQIQPSVGPQVPSAVPTAYPPPPAPPA